MTIWQLRADGTCIGNHRVVRSRKVFRTPEAALEYAEEWRASLLVESDPFHFDHGEPLNVTASELELVGD